MSVILVDFLFVNHVSSCPHFRLHMLGKSCDQLPYNIVFVLEDEGSPDEVIGHSRLCRVHGQEESCFMESGMDSALY